MTGSHTALSPYPITDALGPYPQVPPEDLFVFVGVPVPWGQQGPLVESGFPDPKHFVRCCLQLGV